MRKIIGFDSILIEDEVLCDFRYGKTLYFMSRKISVFNRTDQKLVKEICKALIAANFKENEDWLIASHYSVIRSEVLHEAVFTYGQIIFASRLAMDWFEANIEEIAMMWKLSEKGLIH